MLTLEGEPPTLETCASNDKEAYKRYSKPFRKMIASCLQKVPSARPDATELLKNPFFKRAKGKEYLIGNMIELAPGLSDRGRKVKKKPQSGKMTKNAEGDWEFGSSDEDLSDNDDVIEGDTTAAATAPTPAAVQTPTPTPTPSVPENKSSEKKLPVEAVAAPPPAPVAAVDPDAANITKVLDLTLRLRNSEKELNDIRFEFNEKVDTVEGVSQELMSAGLIDGKDLLLVGANLNKIIANTIENKQIKFALKSAQEDINDRDENLLIGYAMLTLNN